jgi:dihydropyrimidine dehydrogenase (NAD+) subunit PreT
MVQSSFSVQHLAQPGVETGTHPRFDIERAHSRTSRAHGAARIRQLDWLLFALFILGTGALLIRGWQFYTLTIGERVDHPDFRVLGPSTSLGRAYGIAGTCMMLTNLLYLLRRRFAGLPFGSLRAWLDVHTFTGLFGGLLVVFHSAFQLRSSIAVITVGSLFVVLLTGIIGRSIYALTPKPDRLRLERHLRQLDPIGPGMGDVLRRRLALVARTQLPPHASLFRVLIALPAFARESRRRCSVIERTAAEYAHHFSDELRQHARSIAECSQIHRAEVRAAAAEALLRSWRGLHRLSALSMVALVALHIAIAWYYGFIWAFSG